MKVRIGLYILTVTGIMLTGCHKHRDVDEQRYTWSTESPLSIPYRIRLQRLEKVNLVRNSSFELGRTFAIDSSRTSFVLDGWQQVGQHVEWLDKRADSLNNSNEVYSGLRAIKISRNTAYESDEQGEGILSDFIKVIPGNYSLSFYTRLENVYPLRARLGTKMYDGVEVSLLFFDRNKIPIKPNFNFPQINQVINTSFKALSFANFSYIRSFGWGKVIGKSNHFPFPEGDIPSNAHYAKIYIGLKGKGTMWVDSVTFKYTDHNFSVAERMLKYTDTTFCMLEALIPTPKKITKMESVVFFKPDLKPEQLPLILIPTNADVLVMSAARLIQQTLQKSIEGFLNSGQKSPVIRIVNGCSEQQLQASKLIISLGKTAMYKKYQEVLPQLEITNHPQGYFIYTHSDFSNLVMLGANNSQGLFYAALTAVQMIDKKAAVFHNARVVDYPDFQKRYYAMNNLANITEAAQQGKFAMELISYKLNGAFSTSSEAEQNAFANDFLKPLTSASGNVLFSLNHLPTYLSPNDTTLTYPYPICFACADSDLLFGINGHLPIAISGFKEYPHFVLPPPFHNQMLDNSDFPERPDFFGKHVKSLYSGSSFFSVFTDDVDIERYASFMGPNPVFMDNSMQISSQWGQFGGANHFYPGKIRLFNIFEPFMNTEIREHFSKLDANLYFVNQPASSEIDIIRLATAADFLWNANSYSKDYALWKVLISRYGAENARALISYAEKYSLMLEVICRLEMKSQMARNFKTGQQAIADLTLLVSKIGESLGPQHKLVKELHVLNTGLRNELNLYAPAVNTKN